MCCLEDVANAFIQHTLNECTHVLPLDTHKYQSAKHHRSARTACRAKVKPVNAVWRHPNDFTNLSNHTHSIPIEHASKNIKIFNMLTERGGFTLKFDTTNLLF